MKKFNIEEQFLTYLELMKLDHEKMPLDQLTETKRAFIGALSQFYIFLFSSAKSLSDDEGAEALVDLQSQLSIYWEVQGITSF